MKFRKKPVVIDAIQFEGSHRSFDAVIRWVILQEGNIENFGYWPHTEKLVIHTLEGDMEASKGDYIICGIKGEFYPCKPDIFLETYEKIE